MKWHGFDRVSRLATALAFGSSCTVVAAHVAGASSGVVIAAAAGMAMVIGAVSIRHGRSAPQPIRLTPISTAWSEPVIIAAPRAAESASYDGAESDVA